jgi:hypothetical protein
MYMCVECVDLASIYDFAIGFLENVHVNLGMLYTIYVLRNTYRLLIHGLFHIVLVISTRP